jgi:hypothetical protein
MHPHTETIAKLETRFWQSMADKDAETAMGMIADECLIAGTMGTMKIDPAKYGEMTRDGQWTLDSFEFSDLEVVFPVDDVAVVAYTVHQTGETKNKPMDMRCADTTTWVWRGAEWKCSAHTETILDKAA